jgi:hypothetical protein
MNKWWANLDNRDRIYALAAVTAIVIAVSYEKDRSRTPTPVVAESVTPTDKAYTDAAQRHGYTGREADQVGAAAERLCAATGKC